MQNPNICFTIEKLSAVKYNKKKIGNMNRCKVIASHLQFYWHIYMYMYVPYKRIVNKPFCVNANLG